MTARNIKKKSLPGDTYYTPEWAVKQCLEIVVPSMLQHAGKSGPLGVLEPGAGKGVFVQALRAWALDTRRDVAICAFDISKEVGPWPEADVSLHGDFLQDAFLARLARSFDLSLGNPPYSHALSFVQRSLQISDLVVFLLRQGFQSTAKRSSFFRETPPVGVWNLAHRLSFTGDGNTDTADYCWIGWQKGWTGRTTLEWLPTVPLSERGTLRGRIKGKIRAKWNPEEEAEEVPQEPEVQEEPC